MIRIAVVTLLTAVCALGAPQQKREAASADLGHETLFVADDQGGGVYAVRPDTGEVVETCETGLFNNCLLAWNERRQELYVAADNGGEIWVLETAPLRKVAAIRENVGWNTMAIAVSPDGERLYASASTLADDRGHKADSRVTVYDLETRKLVGKIALSDRAELPRIALSGDGAKLYVSRDHAFETYDAATLERTVRVETGDVASHTFAVSRDDAIVYETTDSWTNSRATAFDPVTHAARSESIAPSYTLGLARDGERVWVVSGHDVVECDANCRPIRTLPIGDTVYGVEESVDGRSLYVLAVREVGDDIGREIAVVDLPSGSVVKRFPVTRNAARLLDVVVLSDGAPRAPSSAPPPSDGGGARSDTLTRRSSGR